ncbi:non-functional pseudokinase ZED1-like [Prunus avium]|uniref:Non-functional pseudokinase ZED1-like n=1 Tax=Prunus avium TaxID=42229 RepID=A0A6P5T892_PRUAV|nr:non-functional pseudokinase ZED1-like [Prunus avium]
MPSKVLFSWLPCVRKEKRKRSFFKNGSILLEDLIASCDGKSHPIRYYSAAELVKATNNFGPSCIVTKGFHYQMFRGILDDRTVLIKKFRKSVDEAIRDIIISMQMSTHRNALKLLGCYLEFDTPALVLENATKGILQSDGSLRWDNEEDESLLLPWKARLCIAKQLASALTYLHTAFPRPIIHGDVNPTCIFLDDDYVPKLSNFSLSITIPPEQLYVEVDTVKGTMGYLDPNYSVTGKSSEKTDVYSFGVLLLVFLTGQRAIQPREGGDQHQYAVQYASSHAFEDQFRTIVDPKILEDVGEGEQAQQQLHDFLTMALLCTEEESDLRPDVIDVAKKLVQIEKSMFPS